MKKVLIYPGAFNPPHNGHLSVLIHSLNVFNFDEVWIIPSGKRLDKDISISYFHRRVLGGLFIDEIKKYTSIPVLLITAELDDVLGRDTPTILEDLKNRSGAEITQLIGSDGFLNLYPRLQESRSLDKERFILVMRPGYNVPISMTEHAYISLLKDPVGGTVSSTEIRNMFLNRDFSVKKLLPESIFSFLIKYNIYLDM